MLRFRNWSSAEERHSFSKERHSFNKERHSFNMADSESAGLLERKTDREKQRDLLRHVMYLSC